jgi:hypothetical protein
MAFCPDKITFYTFQVVFRIVDNKAHYHVPLYFETSWLYDLQRELTLEDADHICSHKYIGTIKFPKIAEYKPFFMIS